MQECAHLVRRLSVYSHSLQHGLGFFIDFLQIYLREILNGPSKE